MKKTVLAITAATLFTALVTAPMPACAAEKANAPASGQETSAQHKKSEHSPLSFNGKLTAVDKAAMTITVGKRTFEVTSETKITKDGLPATLADAVTGEKIGGAYKKGAGEKMIATSINLGKKSDGAKSEGAAKKQHKKAGDESSNTNSVVK